MPARSDRIFTALAVVAGLLIGFAASTLAYRYHWMRVPPGGLIERMDRVLKLTPAQHDQVLQVLDETRSRMEELRRESEHQRMDVLSQTSDKIRAILTPDQQKDFARYFRLDRSRMGHHDTDPPGFMGGPADAGHGPPPPPP